MANLIIDFRLLDTHTFLWFLSGSEELSKKARKVIEDTYKPAIPDL